jgi:hypothetical protein
MMKPIVAIAFAACVAVAGTFVGMKEAAHPRETPVHAASMPSIQELHTKAHLEGLPIQEAKYPY